MSSITFHLQKSLHSFRVIDVGYIKDLLQQFASCQPQYIIQEVDLEIHFHYLEACIQQWKVSYFWWEVDITGLRTKDFVWCSTSKHPFTPCKRYTVTWGSLSLSMVSLTSVNELHHWLVIRWFLPMFNFRSLIHMVRIIFE